MGFDFTNRLVYGTFFMLWTVLLNTVFSDMTTVACPAPCECRPTSSCTGTYVNCMNKGLKEVPTGIPKDTCNLNLYGNQISRINNNTFKGLPQSETLSLSNNQITRIDNDAFAGLSELRELYLYNNMITSIKSIVFEKFPQLQELYVGGNPFQCTCDLQSFVEFMKGFLPYNSQYYDEPTCSSPDHLKGKEIINVSYHDMTCDSTSSKYSRKRIHFLTLM
ncbi:slit homolog 2 protein-like isoform X2 [Crassostrea angulata]|uniref:slit homolog 2 protein-like isoform X2 n=1 Tax=Magallana angulata TaxID=2784310 RepID=UPI0022B0E286|nr:slit homolog 2 protein-like isoform X2 [Crassostrea angulata]